MDERDEKVYQERTGQAIQGQGPQSERYPARMPMLGGPTGLGRGGNIPMPTPPAERESPLMAAMEHNETELKRLHEIIGYLEQKLSHVMLQIPTKTNGAEGRDQQTFGGSSIVSRLSNHIAAVAMARTRIEALLNHLEV